jgi:hypothetical protein
MELARVDSLALALVLGGTWIARFRASSRAMFAAGLLWGLACSTKQTMLGIAVPIWAWMVVARGPRSAVWALAGTALVIGAGTLYFVLRSGDWYLYYTVSLPQMHAIRPDLWRFVWKDMIRRPFTIAALAGALAFAGSPPRRDGFYVLLLLVGLALSTLTMMHTAAAANDLMPGWMVLAMGFGLAVAWLSRAVTDPRDGRQYRLGRAAALVGLVGTALQLGRLRYDVKAQLPTAQDVAAGRKVIARIKAIDGEVWIPNHGYLATLAGKPTHAQAWAIADITRSFDVKHAATLTDDIVRALASHRFAAIVDDGRPPSFNRFGHDASSYRFAEDILAGVPGLDTRCGVKTRPEYLYLPSP